MAGSEEDGVQRSDTVVSPWAPPSSRYNSALFRGGSAGPGTAAEMEHQQPPQTPSPKPAGLQRQRSSIVKRLFGTEDQGTPPDSMLEQLNNTSPSVFFSVVARFPVFSFILCLATILLLCIPAVLSPPKMNTDFGALIIKDHPSSKRNIAAGISLLQYRDFWESSKASGSRIVNVAPPERRLLGLSRATQAADADFQVYAGERVERVSQLRSTEDVSEASLDTEALRSAGRTTLSLIFKSQQGNGHQCTMGDPGSGLDRCPCTRPGDEDYLLHIFYRNYDDSNVLTPEMVAKALAVEKKMMQLPSYQELCLRQADGSCHAPVGFPLSVYGQPAKNVSIPSTVPTDMEDAIYTVGDEARDIEQVAEAFIDQNLTLFFNVDANSTYAEYLHTIVPFCTDLQQNVDDKDDETDSYRRDAIPDLVRLFTEEAKANDIIINYGERNMNDYQVRQTLLYDSLWAILSLALAATTLRIGCGSTFVTAVGIFQVLVSFPISWVIYSTPTQWEYLTFIHLLAPFVIFGIGLDDIFVFVTYFQRTQKYSSLFALDTRLTATFNAAASATLATSTTSAFAFLANVLSPVPAIQSFGLVLATLVLVNYMLAVSWIPVSLALWDSQSVLPKRRRVAMDPARTVLTTSGHSATVGALQTDRTTARMGSRKHVAEAKPEDFKDLEYDVLLFRNRPPEQHRLAVHPSRRPLLELPNQESAKSERSCVTKVREDVFDWIFVWVWKYRLPCMLTCLLITACGGIGAARLRPPRSSEPPLFHKDHNLQFFYRYITSEEAENVPSCPSCDISIDDLLLANNDFLARNSSGPDFIQDELGGKRPVETRSESRSRVPMVLAWGLDSEMGTGRSDAALDPSAPPQPADIVFDESFDPSLPDTQRMILSQIEDSATRGPGALMVSVNPLDRLAAWCKAKAAKDLAAAVGCVASESDSSTDLPVGENFNKAVFLYLYDHPDAQNHLGYSIREPMVANLTAGVADGTAAAPKVAWMRAQVTTTTRKDESPLQISLAYEAWTSWAELAQQEYNYTGMLAASEDWVYAVTYTQIAEGVRPTVFFSIFLAGAVVFVFTGRIAVTLLSTLTVLMINVTVMGCTWLMGWSLGALEGMSITSLVGLSVDFCIHMSEAHMHAHGDQRYKKARSALAVIGIPMVNAALSTVMTTLPLFGTHTLVLQRFATVIAITMIVGLAYVVLFLSPAMAIFGPDNDHVRVPRDAGQVKRMLVLTYGSKSVRFVAICAAILAAGGLIPQTRRLLQKPGTFQTMYDAIVVVMVVALVGSVVRLALQWKKLRERRSDWGSDSRALPGSFVARTNGTQ